MKVKSFDFEWADDFNGAITVCDREGMIVYMNMYSKKQFEKYGGEKLLGTNLLDCHPEPSKIKLAEMLKNRVENTYIVEKNGVTKIIHQSPLFSRKEFYGIVEISFEINPEMPHFTRD